MTAYYNEWDRYAAQWLRNLIEAGHLPAGEVDERSITDVTPSDLAGFDQCHFFAGIGGWPLALRLAGWPDDRPARTGSCPCQPLSSAGQRKGHADERHLWPAFHGLIAERRPATVFGEQVASKDGREWLAGVRADLEALGYAVGAADLCAAGVGAPHIRQRLFWLGDAGGARLEERPSLEGNDGSQQPPAERTSHDAGRVAHAEGARKGVFDSNQKVQKIHTGANIDGCCWNGANTWIECSDGKARRTQSGIFPLAHGVFNRVGKLRAAGNAIVPRVGAEFVAAFMECRP